MHAAAFLLRQIFMVPLRRKTIKIYEAEAERHLMSVLIPGWCQS
jgi:hypothetical protein